jgi:hypothetical protein
MVTSAVIRRTGRGLNCARRVSVHCNAMLTKFECYAGDVLSPNQIPNPGGSTHRRFGQARARRTSTRSTQPYRQSLYDSRTSGTSYERGPSDGYAPCLPQPELAAVIRASVSHSGPWGTRRCSLPTIRPPFPCLIIWAAASLKHMKTPRTFVATGNDFNGGLQALPDQRLTDEVEVLQAHFENSLSNLVPIQRRYLLSRITLSFARPALATN